MITPPSAAIAAAPRRLIVTSPMKCGSTYAAHIVARYLGTDVPAIEFDWLAEHRLTSEVAAQLRDRPFVLALHLLPRSSSLEVMQREHIQASVLWRNLADTIVSFDDHTRRYGAHNPVFRLDGERYARLAAQERYRYAIDRVVPWNLDFYLAWRDLAGLPLHPYEMMVHDGFAFFRFLLWQQGVPLDDARLRAVLADVPEESRFNVGVVGRAARAFDDETKRRLERRIVEHPEFDELEVLLWELPWEPLELTRRSPLDGTAVRSADDRAWFVSRGIRHAVTDRWLASRGRAALRAPRAALPGEVEALPEGPPFS